MSNYREIIRSLARYNETNFKKFRINGKKYITSLGTLYQNELTTNRGQQS